MRRKRHDARFQDATLFDLALLPITIDPDTNRHAWSETLRLAGRLRQLTVDDAAYLELALRRGLPLATRDQELRRAAEAESAPLLGV